MIDFIHIFRLIKGYIFFLWRYTTLMNTSIKWRALTAWKL